MMETLSEYLPFLIKSSYFLAAILFITGLRRMSAPGTARGGIVWAGVGMLVATVATFLLPDMHNMVLILAALVSSTVLAWVSGKKVAMTDMPGPSRCAASCPLSSTMRTAPTPSP